jgi:hypothetical protein
MSNNVRDIFIECLQGDKLLGEVRVTLFDAKQKAVKKPQPILAHETYVPSFLFFTSPAYLCFDFCFIFVSFPIYSKARIGEMKLSVKYSPTPVGGKK